MDCNETRRLLEADVDGELDLVRHLELAAHLQVCPDCARQAENVRARSAALREALPRFTASPQLVAKIKGSLPAEDTSVPARPTALRRSAVFWPVWRVAGIAASLAVTLLAGYTWGNARAHANFLIEDGISDHVRSLQAGHLTDVASTDQHTVKPWFAGKLDFSPPVADLASSGFPLIGGRLEHLDGHPAAALVFHRRQHAINLFIWPTGDAPMASRLLERNGYHAEAWSRNGFNFLAISEIPATELTQFAGAFRAIQP